nr:arabinofuranosyltransferase [Actinomycetospora corticicola]
MVAAGATCVVLLALLGRLRLPFPTYAGVAVAATASAVLVAVLVWLGSAERRARSAVATVGVPALLAALVTLWLGLLLQGTRWYLGGISIDQSFRTQILTRFASTPALVDMNYVDLPSYYPAAWFWLGGRLADLGGIPGWAFYKPWSILTLCVAAWAASVAWRLVVSPARAVLVALATAVVGLGVSAAEPYAWLLVAPMPAVAILVWRAVRADDAGHRPAALAGGGVFLGVAAMTYSLHAGFFGVFVVLAAVVPTRGRRIATMVPRLARAGLVVLIGLALALVVWAPYVLAVLSGDPTRSYAQRYLPSDGAFWSLPMLQPTPLGALCLVGLIGIVLGWTTRARLARPLGVLALLVLAWFALTVPLLLVGQTSLAFRLAPVIELVLVCAGVLTAIDLALRVRDHRPEVRAAGGVLAALVLFAAAQGAISPDSGPVAEAYVDPYPTGATPTGGVDRSRIDAWTPELLAAVHAATATPATDLVTLGGPTQFYVAEPFHGFQQSTPHYANPLAQYEDRNEEIRSWAGAADAAELVRRLDASPWPAPRVFVLLRQPDGSGTTRLVEDVFPATPNVAFTTASFPARLFASPAFTVRDVGPYLVAVRR